MIDFDALILELQRAGSLATSDPARVDSLWLAETALRVSEALRNASDELLPLRSLVSDLDELMDEGDLFQADHSCKTQRRMAQWYREIYKPNAMERGHRRPGHTYGRGRG